ncbi:sensory box/GGDEF family domain protein, partial [Vibrio parahaemolyticus V-223/04]
IMCLS